MRVVKPAVYILASKRNGTLYVGVTDDLAARAIHKQDLSDGFTRRYVYIFSYIMRISIRWETLSHARKS